MGCSTRQLHRRDAMIRVGQAGLGALALPGMLQAQKAAVGNGTGGKAKSVILIYLWGGPPQMDMWDPNPEAASGIRSLFKPIPTKVPGIHVSEAMPLFAKWTHKTAIIRSLTHDSNEHGNSVYYTLTGHKDASKTFGRNKRSRKDWPGMGSVLAGLRPVEGLPGTVTIPRPIGHDGVTYSGSHAGFMGPRHDPLKIGRVAEEKGTDELYPMSLPKEVSKTRLLARKMLDHTIVICAGEFGRTLKINAASGRDHWPTGFSMALAGGGFRAGHVHGAPDPTGKSKQPADSIQVADIHSTILHTLGIEYDKAPMTPIGRPIALSNGQVIKTLLKIT